MHACARTVGLLSAALLTVLSVSPFAIAKSSSRSNSKVTICHATSSTTNPYVTITVSENALSGHSGHSNDLIPAPTSGCPTTSSNGDSTDTGDETTESGGGNTGSGDGETTKPTKTTICHSTSSQTNPYVKITVANAALKAHSAHTGDIIPAPITGCPQLTSPPPSLFRCTAATPVLGWASGPNAVTLRSCTGIELRVWGDPWITYSTKGAAPQTFGVGFGAWGLTLSNGARVDWVTDPARRNGMSALSVIGASASSAIVMKPSAYPVATDRGERRISVLPLNATLLTELRNALLGCKGMTQQPIACA